MNQDVIYLLLIFALLVIPRAVQRFSVPAPLTCLVFGIGAVLWLGDGAHDAVVNLLAILGISSLFLFAGLEVDLAQLRKGLWPLLLHLLIRSATLVGVAWLAWHYASLSWQAAGLLALALLTPSTGFIMDSLAQLGLAEEERFWVTSKAIAGELLALVAMFVVMQANDPVQLGLSSLVLAAMLVGLPLLFIGLGRWVAPHAPGSEFSLLVMVGMLAAYITYWLGVYYLVGAFIAGLVARLLQRRMPLLASHDNLHALRLFSSFFVPFYFFNSGTHVPGDALSLEALGLGVLITLVVLPLRLAVIVLQRRVVFGESLRSSLRVALALSPTLIFTLVLAGIMREHFAVPPVLYGALLFYAAVTTLLPSLVFRNALDVDPAQYERPADEAQAAPAKTTAAAGVEAETGTG